MILYMGITALTIALAYAVAGKSAFVSAGKFYGAGAFVRAGTVIEAAERGKASGIRAFSDWRTREKRSSAYSIGGIGVGTSSRPG